MPLYQPHQAAIYRLVNGVYTYTGNNAMGHLTNRGNGADLEATGWNNTQVGEFIYNWEDFYNIKQGDRLLVDGDYWNVIAIPQRRNEIYILRESRAQVEKTFE